MTLSWFRFTTDSARYKTVDEIARSTSLHTPPPCIPLLTSPGSPLYLSNTTLLAGQASNVGQRGQAAATYKHQASQRSREISVRSLPSCLSFFFCLSLQECEDELSPLVLALACCHFAPIVDFLDFVAFLFCSYRFPFDRIVASLVSFFLLRPYCLLLASLFVLILSSLPCPVDFHPLVLLPRRPFSSLIAYISPSILRCRPHPRNPPAVRRHFILNQEFHQSLIHSIRSLRFTVPYFSSNQPFLQLARLRRWKKSETKEV